MKMKDENKLKAIYVIDILVVHMFHMWIFIWTVEVTQDTCVV